jgi:hypothetical protein
MSFTTCPSCRVSRPVQAFRASGRGHCKACQKKPLKRLLDPTRSNYMRVRREALSDDYVASLLGLTKATAPPPLIELKRAHLMVRRALKEVG